MKIRCLCFQIASRYILQIDWPKLSEIMDRDCKNAGVLYRYLTYETTIRRAFRTIDGKLANLMLKSKRLIS
jgi:hypothetical protein